MVVFGSSRFGVLRLRVPRFRRPWLALATLGVTRLAFAVARLALTTTAPRLAAAA
jgi:hypothetical protein